MNTDERIAREYHASPSRRRAGARRPFVVGLTISAVIHVLAVIAYPIFMGPLRVDGTFPPVFAPPVSDGGTEVVNLIELLPPDATDPDDPVEIEEAGEPEVEVDAPDLEDDYVRFPGRYRSAADRLRAGQGDARLWRGVDGDLVEPTPEDVARLRMLTAIEAMNDSAAAAAELEARMTDWTHTDEDGNRWGVSPGRLHLGKVSIPLPFGFGPPPDYNGDRAARAFQFNDIDQAAGSRAVRESWKERMEVMRRRRELRRAQEQEDEATRTEVVRPDTTRVPRRR